jgi:hypothetical protein
VAPGRVQFCSLDVNRMAHHIWLPVEREYFSAIEV